MRVDLAGAGRQRDRRQPIGVRSRPGPARALALRRHCRHLALGAPRTASKAAILFQVGRLRSRRDPA
jgi:hypothetical protein